MIIEQGLKNAQFFESLKNKSGHDQNHGRCNTISFFY